jgi:hypothetical protein
MQTISVCRPSAAANCAFQYVCVLERRSLHGHITPFHRSATDDLTYEQLKKVQKSAEKLYGLVHARFVLTSRGMQRMVCGWQRASQPCSCCVFSSRPARGYDVHECLVVLGCNDEVRCADGRRLLACSWKSTTMATLAGARMPPARAIRCCPPASMV